MYRNIMYATHEHDMFCLRLNALSIYLSVKMGVFHPTHDLINMKKLFSIDIVPLRDFNPFSSTIVI